MVLPLLHPLAKTSIECRRAIQRLEQFAELNSYDEYVRSNLVSEIIENLKEVRRNIPKHLVDVDLDK